MKLWFITSGSFIFAMAECHFHGVKRGQNQPCPIIYPSLVRIESGTHLKTRKVSLQRQANANTIHTKNNMQPSPLVGDINMPPNTHVLYKNVIRADIDLFPPLFGHRKIKILDAQRIFIIFFYEKIATNTQSFLVGHHVFSFLFM